MLRTQKRTAPVHDLLPSWLLRTCSFELAEPVAHLYNCSIHSGVVHNPWRTAVVTPVPNVPCPASLNDYRPISITQLLSRIVRRFIRPAIPADAVTDQFAFKPTGSTTVHVHFSVYSIASRRCSKLIPMSYALLLISVRPLTLLIMLYFFLRAALLPFLAVF